LDWLPGNASGSGTLTDEDDIYAEHINQLREAADGLDAYKVEIGGDLGGLTSFPTVKSRSVTFTIGHVPQMADYICDGIDDDEEVQEALDALIAGGGGNMTFLAGTFNLSTNLLIVGSDINFRGQGWRSTVFRLNDAVNRECIVVGDGATSCNNVSFFDFALDGNKAGQTATGGAYPGGTGNLLRYRSDAQNSYGGVVDGIHGYNGKQNAFSNESHSFVTYRNCQADNMDGYGYWSENGSFVNYEHCWSRNNLSSGFVGTDTDSNSYTDCHSYSDDGNGFAMIRVSMTSFKGCHVNRAGWHGGGGADTESNGFNISLSKSISFIGNVAYASMAHGLVLNGSTFSVFMGNTFRGNGQYADNVYSDVYLTNAGGGAAVTDSVIRSNTFMNDITGKTPFVTKYNIGTEQANYHKPLQIDGNLFGSPGTANTHNVENTEYVDLNNAVVPNLITVDRGNPVTDSQYVKFAAGAVLDYYMGRLANNDDLVFSIDAGAGKVEKARITSAGKFVSQASAINVKTAQTPASAGAAGTAGDICWDAGFMYVCVSTNTWKRVAIATW
jgi:hypothetical protein